MNNSIVPERAKDGSPRKQSEKPIKLQVLEKELKQSRQSAKKK